MKKVIETSRLILREFEETDAENIWKLNSNHVVIRYTGDPPFESVDQAREFLINYKDYAKNGFGRWAVIRKEDDEFIGWCGLKLNEEGLVDLGFRFFKTHWNSGYATEASKACLDYGFNQLGIDQIIGRAWNENRASIRVLEKLNMRFWKFGQFDNIDNAAYYKIDKEEFDPA